MRMKPAETAILCLLFLEIIYIEAGHVDTPTYFHRKHPDGSEVDRNDEEGFFAGLDCEVVERRGTSILKSKISIDPSRPLENGEKVTLSWKIKGPVSYKDIIGIYCPKEGGIEKALDYFYSSVSPTWQQGYGSFNVKVFNLRSDCEFRYYAKQGKECTLMAKSSVLQFKGGHGIPLQAHIALGNDASQMRIMWVSGSGKKVFV